MSREQAKRIADALEAKPGLLADVLHELEDRKIARDGDRGYSRGFHHQTAKLVADWATKYKMRTDWHEPDEQDITAFVFGTRLDNACGNHIDQKAIDGEYQELVVEIAHRPPLDDGREGPADDSLRVNLANLLAIVTRYYREHVAPSE